MFDKIWDAKYAAGDSLNKYPWDKIVSFVFRYYPRDKDRRATKILEVGFGSGCNLWFCAKEGFDTYGVEASHVAVEHAKKWFNQQNLNAQLAQQSFAPLNFESNLFDLAIDRGSLTCVSFENCLSSLKEIYRVLKPGGYFCFNPYSSHHTSCLEGTLQDSGLTKITSGTLIGVGDIKFYNHEELNQIISKTGFTIKEMRHIEDKYFYPTPSTHAEYFLVLRKPK